VKKLIVVILTIVVSLGATQIIAGGKGDPTGLDTKVAVCHKPFTPAAKVLWVPPLAVPGHLIHGDSLGSECPVE
jgi:hypothetical protein